MTLGKCNFTDVIYVALIDSDVLLGVDLLNKHKAKIDLLNFNLCFQGFDIPMVFGGQEEDSNIPLFVKNTVRIPPRSIARISCKIKVPLSQFLVEPIYSLRGLIPRSLQKSYDEIEFPVVNPTDQNLHWRNDQIIGQAQEAPSMDPEMCDFVEGDRTQKKNQK